MSDVVTIILPVFGLVGVGYLATFFKLINDNAADGLSAYILNIAIPMLLFKVIGTGTLPDVSPWHYWFSYFLGVAATWAIISLFLKSRTKIDYKSAVIAGCTASYSNTVLVGIPLVLIAFPEDGAVPLVLLLSVHLPIMTMSAILLIEFSGNGLNKGFLILKDIATAIFLNPIIIALIVGSIWRFTGVEIPVIVDDIIDPIGKSAIPCALVAMGITVRRYGFDGNRLIIASVLAGKLLIHPLLVFIFAKYIFDLPARWIGVATLFAATPPGITTYILATKYGTSHAMVSGSIALGTALSILTISIILLVI